MMKGGLCATVFILLCLLGVGCATGGLDHGGGVWAQFAGQGDLGRVTPSLEGTLWWFDAHARHNTEGADTTIVRPGVGVTVGEGMTAWLGYAWVRNWLSDGENVDEHRFWQQFMWTTPLDPFIATSRTRLEQRFRENGDDVGWRLVQFFRLDHLLEDSPARLVAWDLLFFDLNETDWGTDPGFRQNRLFAGVGWDLDEDRRWRFEAGYLNQYIHRSSREDTMNHILSVNLFLTY